MIRRHNVYGNNLTLGEHHDLMSCMFITKIELTQQCKSTLSTTFASLMIEVLVCYICNCDIVE